MKKTLLFLVFFLPIISIYSQGADCASAEAFCSDSALVFPNTFTGTNAEAGPDYGCLGSQPDPAWYFMQIGNSDRLEVEISQVNTFGTPIDVDFIVWGPFTDPVTPCTAQLTGGCAGDHNCFGNTVDCSFDPAPVENFTIPNALTGEFYIVLITNFDGDEGFITFEQTNFGQPGAATTDCTILCSVTVPTDQTLCVDNPYTITTTLGNPAMAATATYKWFRNGMEIMGETNATLDINSLVPTTDTYTVEVTAMNCATLATDDIIVTYTDPYSDFMLAGISTIEECEIGNTNVGDFNLTQNEAQIANLADPNDYTFTYFTDPGFTTQITTPASYNNSAANETIYVNISHNTLNNCEDTTSFDITMKESPQLIDPSNQMVCNNQNTAAVIFSSDIPGTTYSWINSSPSVGLTASGTGDIPSFTAINTTNNPVSANIWVTPSFNGCNGTPQNFSIIVNPTPIMDDPSDHLLCDGDTVPAINFTSPVAGTTYSWVNDTPTIGGLAANGTGNIPSFTAVNNTNAPLVLTVTVTPDANSCGSGVDQVFTITINPTPVMNDPADQVLCNNDTVAATNFTSAVAGTTYSWTNDTPSIGLVANGTGDIAAFTAINTSNAPVTATITVTPDANACGNGVQETFTVTVNPTPVMDDPADQVLCNSDMAAATNFTSLVTGTTYTWTNDTPGIGLAASGTGDIPAFTVVNTSNTPITAMITVTPDANSCGNGVQQIFGITVNPTPMMDDPADQIICDNDTTAATIFNSPVAGTTYSWVNDTPTIGGLAANGTGDIPAFTAVNNSNSPLVLTVTVTPSVNGCVGPDQTFTFTINPTPIMNDPNDQVVCNNGMTAAVSFTGNIAGTGHSWVNDTPSIGLAANGTGDVANFTAINTTNTPIVATIVVTPTINGCVGTTESFTITVNPTPVMDDPSDQVLCNNDTTTATIFTSPVAGTTYSWTNDTPSIGLAANGTGDITAFTASNPTNTPVIATITVTPDANACGNGVQQSFTITVNPTPIMDDPADQVLCNNDTTAATTFTSPVAGTTYSWTNDTPSIGLAANGTGDIAAFTAINTSNSPVIATITVTPDANACGNGVQQSFTITVNPTPVMDDPADQVLCDNDMAVATIFSSPVAGTTYSWTNDTPSIGLAANGTGDIVAFMTSNTSNAPVTATITVTPDANACGNGIQESFTITVNPTPNMDDPADQVVCNNDMTAATIFTSMVAGTNYSWTNDTPGIGLAANGTGDIAAFTAINTSNAPVTATITVTPDANSCVGVSQSFTITINPTPVMDDPADQVFCNNDTIAAINFTSLVAGTTYSWINDTPSIGLAASGTGNIASFTAINTSNAPVTAIITVTPDANACGDGIPEMFTITVNPTPIMDDPIDQELCDNQITNFTFFFSPTQDVTFTWVNDNPSIGLVANGSGNNISSFTAINTTTIPVTANITVTPSANGCVGPSQTYTILVNPRPTLIDPVDLQFCHNEMVSATNFTSLIAGTTYAWSNDNTTIGLVASGFGDIPAFTATNTTNTPITATITVTPDANNCGNGIDQQFTITINPLPVINEAVILDVCDIDANNYDGETVVNLSLLDSLVTTEPNITFTYFPSINDADNNTSQLPTNHTISAFQQVIVKATNQYGCYRLATADVTVFVSQIPQDFHLTYEECDDLEDDNDDANGINTFNIGASITEIRTLFPNDPNIVITFYESQSNAELQIDEIPDPFEYRNLVPAGQDPELPVVQTIWVRVDNVLSDPCPYVEPLITLIVNPLPAYNVIYDPQICIGSMNTVSTDLINIVGNYSYSWYLQDLENGNQLLSNDETLDITTPGNYVVTVTDDTTQCIRTQVFQVVESEAPSIIQVDVVAFNKPNNQVIIEVSGNGNYEFALDNTIFYNGNEDDRPFQSSNLFENLNAGEYEVTIRDVNLCGEVRTSFVVLDYNPFFTPNGDSINDVWTIDGMELFNTSKVYIFDRHGKVLAFLDNFNREWDGVYNGKIMNDSDYWFKIEYTNSLGITKTERGHFSLINRK